MSEVKKTTAKPAAAKSTAAKPVTAKPAAAPKAAKPTPAIKNVANFVEKEKAAAKATPKAVAAKPEAKAAPKAAKPKGKAPYETNGEIKVVLIRGLQGCTKKQLRTVMALGLKKTNDEKIHKDNPAIRGMVTVVAHLVSVEKVG